ncbi:hypothetical protein D3C74_215250 [compost metagenome]
MNFDVTMESALRSIIFEQMSQHFCVSQIVDGHNLDIAHLLNSTKSESSDPPKTVNAYFYTH